MDVVDQYKSAADVFRELAFGAGAGGTRLSMDVCRVFDAATTGDEDHNCLACALKDLLEEISTYLDVIVANEALFLAEPRRPLGFRQLVSLLNTFWEIVRDAFELLKLDESYYESHDTFPALTEVRRWTNFFKHPGPFAYKMHHPEFFHDGTDEAAAAKVKRPDHTVVLAARDIHEHWKYNDKKKGKDAVLSSLGEAKTAIVILPNLADLATAISAEVELLTDILCAPPFAQRLASETTVEEFFCFERSADLDGGWGD